MHSRSNWAVVIITALSAAPALAQDNPECLGSNCGRPHEEGGGGGGACVDGVCTGGGCSVWVAYTDDGKTLAYTDDADGDGQSDTTTSLIRSTTASRWRTPIRLTSMVTAAVMAATSIATTTASSTPPTTARARATAASGTKTQTARVMRATRATAWWSTPRTRKTASTPTAPSACTAAGR